MKNNPDFLISVTAWNRSHTLNGKLEGAADSCGVEAVQSWRPHRKREGRSLGPETAWALAESPDLPHRAAALCPS